MSASSEVQQLLAYRFSPTDFVLNETGVKPSSLDPVEKIYDGHLTEMGSIAGYTWLSTSSRMKKL